MIALSLPEIETITGGTISGLAPDAEVVTIEAARTLVPLEQPGSLASHVRGFWERIDRAVPAPAPQAHP